jgi:DNA-binding MarR family transcriptional regulator
MASNRTARQQLGPSEDVAQLPAEERMSLGFVAFLMRTRMESYLSAGLREADMVSGDYALLSLLAVEGQLTPAVLARLVGVAPSTLGSRLNALTERGWVKRRANPANSRSWLLQLTPAGWAAYHAAVPYAKWLSTVSTAHFGRDTLTLSLSVNRSRFCPARCDRSCPTPDVVSARPIP